MRKIYTRGLALLLALAMVTGDFLPAAAAEPTEVTETSEVTETTEETAVPEAEDVPAAEAAEEAKAEPEAEVEQPIPETAEAEPEKQAAAAEVLELGNEFTILSGENKEYTFIPEAAGYYELSMTNMEYYSVYDSNQKRHSFLYALTEDGNTPICYYLEAGETYTYRIQASAAGSATGMLQTVDHVVSQEAIALNQAVTVEAGTSKFLRFAATADKTYYVGTYGGGQFMSGLSTTAFIPAVINGVAWYSITGDGISDFYVAKPAGDGAFTVIVSDHVPAENELILGLPALQAAEMSEFTFVPEESGYYLVDSEMSCTVAGPDGAAVSNVYVPMEGMHVEAYRLTAGDVYTIYTYSYIGGNETLTITKAENIEIHELKLGTPLELEGSEGIVKFSCKEGKTYYIGITPGGQISYSNEVYSSGSFDFEDTRWETLTIYQTGTAYMTFSGATTETTRVELRETLPVSSETIGTWEGSITLQPGETKFFEYETEKTGDYLFELPDNVYWSSILAEGGQQLSCTMAGINYGGYYYDEANGMGPGTVVFSIDNQNQEAVTLPLKTHEDFKDQYVQFDENMTANCPAGDTRYYVSFAPDVTDIYYRYANGNVVWVDCSEATEDAYNWEVWEEGKKYVICVDAYAEGSFTLESRSTEISGESATLDFAEIYRFTPTKTGTYALDENTVQAKYYDEEGNSFIDWDYDQTEKYYSLYMEAGKTYLIHAGSNNEAPTQLSLLQNVTVLDFDYYQAFLASGGAVSVDGEGNLSILKGTAKWVLKQATAAVVAGDTSGFAKGNLYWKGKTGAFAAKEFYKLVTDENGESTLQFVSEYDLKDGDVAVIRYMPDIVWATDLTLHTANGQTVLETGDTQRLYAGVSYGQDKYLPADTGKTTQITWYSSNPAVATVDQYTGEVTAVAAGDVTIKAYADEDLWHEEFNKNTELDMCIASASIDLTVCEKPVLESMEIVMPGAEKDELGTPVLDVTLPYLEEEGIFEAVQVNATVKGTPSSYLLDREKVVWSVTPYAQHEGNTFTFDTDGIYELTASYINEDGSEVTAKAYVNVEYGQMPVLTRDAEKSYVKNLNPNLTFGEIRDGLLRDELNVSPDGVNTKVLFKNEKGAVIADTMKLSALFGKASEQKLTAEYYELQDGQEVLADTTTLTLRYADIVLKEVRSENGEYTLESASAVGTGYAFSVYLNPILSYAGYEFSTSELSSLGITLSLDASVKNNAVMESQIVLDSVYVNGMEPGKTDVTVSAALEWSDESGQNRSVSLGTKTLKFTVVGERSVHSIEISDQYGVLGMGDDAYYIGADVVANNAVEEPLTLHVLDFADEAYENLKEANLKWTTTNKKVASVKVDKATGEATLVIAKKAGGVAEITATAGDSKQCSKSFKVVVYDTDVRMETTSLTVNSQSGLYSGFHVYPNNLADVEIVDIRIVDEAGVPDTRFFTRYVASNGEFLFSFVDPDYEKCTIKAWLKITQQTIDGNSLPIIYKPITIKNVPSLPKVKAKTSANYNKFWKDGEAAIVLTAQGKVEEITLDHELFEIQSKTLTGEEKGAEIWEITVAAKAAADLTDVKKADLEFEVTYEDYRRNAIAKVSLKLEDKKPTYTLGTTYNLGKADNSLIFYPEAGQQRVSVLVPMEEDQKNELVSDWLWSGSTDLIKLTGKGADLFEIEHLQGNGEGKGLDVVLRTKSLKAILPGKSGEIAFEIRSNLFADTEEVITTKKVKATALKVSTLKASLVNADNGSTATAYTFQQLLAEEEVLRLNAAISTQALKCAYTSYEAADAKTAEALQSGKLVVKRVEDGGVESFVIKATPELFAELSKCQLKFTTYVESHDPSEEGAAQPLKSVTLKLSLKKQKEEVPVTAAAKVKGSLNVVDPDSFVTVTPTFKNLPLGAELLDVKFRDNEKNTQYTIRAWNSITGEAELVQYVDGDGNRAELPIGTDKVVLRYRYRLADGSIHSVDSKAVGIKVAQTANVKANVKSVTLYNATAGLGAQYGKTVELLVTKAGNAAVKDVVITGLEGSGIEWQRDDNELCFYVGSEPATEKKYKANAIVTLEGAGTKKGTVVTYKVAITIDLKK